MIGLDTNVVIRYLARNDPAQSTKATQLMERRLTVDKPGFVSVLAMTETAWVLERAYGLTDAEIAATIGAMLQTDVLVIEHEQEVFRAMLALKDRLGSFADALISALGSNASCKSTLTFDKRRCDPRFRIRLSRRRLSPGRFETGGDAAMRRCGDQRCKVDRCASTLAVA